MDNFINSTYNNSSIAVNPTSVSGTLMFPIIWNTFIIPIICVFGMVTNGMCIYIFLQLKLKGDLFKYMFASSCLCFVYLFLCFFSFSFRCTSICSISSTYATRLYHYYIFLYATSILAISKAFIEVIICLERYLAMKNMFLKQKISYKLVLLIIFIFSIFIYTPVLLENQIAAAPSSNNSSGVSYIVKKSDLGQTTELKALVITTFCVRGPVILFALLLIDVLAMIEFKQILKRKQNLTSPITTNYSNQLNKKENVEKIEINLTKLAMTSALLFVVCNFPNAATFILNTLSLNTSTFFTLFVLFSNTVLFIYHGLNFFVYYKFNKKFRSFFHKNADSKLVSIDNSFSKETIGSS